MKWDISEMDSWTYKQFPPGACIPEAGNSHDYVTGGWRSERPWRSDEKCTQCLLGFDLDHCKGCGICAQVCPADAIEMVPEGCDLPGVK